MKIQRASNLIGAARVELAPGVRGPERASGTFTPDDDEFAYVVELSVVFSDGRYVVDKMVCTQVEGGRPVDSIGLRLLPIAKLVTHTVLPYIWQRDAEQQGSTKLTPFDGVSPDDAADGPTDDALRKVALVYSVSYACGQPPAKRVTEVFRLARSTAGRWVTMARERGFLGPTTPGRAGGVTGTATGTFGGSGAATGHAEST